MCHSWEDTCPRGLVDGDRGFESQRMRLQSKDRICGSGRSVRAAEWEVPVGLLSKGPATSLFADHYHMK